MKSIISMFVLFFMISCSSDNTTQPTFDPPADHTVNKDGAMHKSGLNNPEEACASCHGNDLRGGEAPSCHTCHRKKW